MKPAKGGEEAEDGRKGSDVIASCAEGVKTAKSADLWWEGLQLRIYDLDREIQCNKTRAL